MRILVLDDHPLVRAGLADVLRRAPGLEVVGSAPPAGAAWPLLRRMRPDVVVLGCGVDPAYALRFCRRVVRTEPPARVLAVAPAPGPEFAVAAALAGADGVACASGEPEALLAIVRRLGAGRGAPPFPPGVLGAAARTLDADDHPILAMALAGTAPADIAEVLRLPPGSLDARLDAMIARLCAPPERKRGRAPRDRVPAWPSSRPETPSRTSWSSLSTARSS